MGTAGHSQGTVTKVTRGLGLDQTEINFLRDGGWRAGGTERSPLSDGVEHRGDKQVQQQVECHFKGGRACALSCCDYCKQSHIYHEDKLL